MVSNMESRADIGDEGLITESGGELEKKATRLSRSVARRLDFAVDSSTLAMLEVVMAGSVAEARRSLGLALLLLLLRVDESLRGMGRDDEGEGISGMWS
jgi:hypothetical protein